MGKNNAKLVDIETILAAGIDPRTGLPRKFIEGIDIKHYIKNVLSINDEQVAINRYKWLRLPLSLDGQLIERVLYYRGQGTFFYIRTLDQFFFLPYALSGEIDVYGRYMGITPLPFNGSTGSDEREQKPWIKGLIRTPWYKPWLPDMPITMDDVDNACVLLSDYSKQISQYVTPRYNINQGIIDIEADCIPFMHTALLKGTGINGMRVNSEDEQSNVESANRSMYDAALSGRINIPIVAMQEFQEFTGGNISASEQFLIAMQAIDNFRLGTMGLENGGLFQKKAHQLEREAALNGGGGAVSVISQDGLINRQNFCDIVNSLWGLDIWCEVAEAANGIDTNGDRQLIDEKEQGGEMEGEPDDV